MWTKMIALSVVGWTVQATAQTSSQVVNVGTVTAQQVSQGLGFACDATVEWEWAAVAAAGGRHCRLQDTWGQTEGQTPAPENKSTGYHTAPYVETAYGLAKRYGIHPTLVTGYIAPFHPVVGVTIPAGAPVGATSITVQFALGVNGSTLANVTALNTHICPDSLARGGALNPSMSPCSSQFQFRAYPSGVLITSVQHIDATHAVLGLASAVKHAIPADQTIYGIQTDLYPSANNQSPTSVSNVAYGNYVAWLASDMAAHGLTGDVEMWNEPPKINYAWGFRHAMYDLSIGPAYNAGTGYRKDQIATERGKPYISLQDNNTGHDPASSPAFWSAKLPPNADPDPPPMFGADFGSAANVMTRTLPPGITVTWNGSSGSANGGVLSHNMEAFTGQALVEPSRTITKDSFHPYSGHFANPEDMMFVVSCLKADVASPHPTNCQLPGQAGASNMWVDRLSEYKLQAINSSYGVGAEITETNELPPAAGMRVQQGRAVIRQFLGFQADGFTPVEFYHMFEGGGRDPGFSMVAAYDSATGVVTPTPALRALSGLMRDVNLIAKAPVGAVVDGNLTAVAHYSGTYALATVHIVGSRSGAKANSDLLAVWQISACLDAASCWFSLPSPAAAPVTLALPPGTKVSKVIDVLSQTAVRFTTAGRSVSFAVADDPIEVLVDPS